MIDVIWKPFQIDPGTAVAGESFDSYNQRRWGSSSWTHSLRTAVDGRDLFTNWKWWPNTKKAHQLVQYLTTTTTTTTTTTAATKSNGGTTICIDSDKVNQVLFVAAYEQGLNISTVDVLMQVAQAAFAGRGTGGGGREEAASSSSSLQIDWDDLRDYLEHDRGWNEVEREMEVGRRRFRIRGVPYFVIANDNDDIIHTLSGAQPVSAFRSILDAITD